MASFIPLPDASTRYNNALTGFLEAALQEGQAFLREEPGFSDIEKNLRYMTDGDLQERRPRTIAWYTVNRSSKAIGEIIAAITDTKPVLGYQTSNPDLSAQADIITKRARSWWFTNDIDLRLGDVTSWAAVTGTGYSILEYDPIRDDTRMTTIDPRDVIPIRPSSRNSIQDCLGIITREPMSLNIARGLFPEFKDRIEADYEGSFWRHRLRRSMDAVQSAVDRLRVSNQTTTDKNVPMVNIFTLQIKDDSTNPHDYDVVMGDLNTNWGYTVKPGQRLYPWGRRIVMTRKLVLWDKPNPYWHGMFTASKLSLDPWPWSWWGKSILKDLIPLNDCLNELVSKIIQAARKNLRPALIYDKNSISKSIADNLDTEKAGLILGVNPVAGEGVKFGDPVNVPSFIMELITLVADQIDDIAGTKGLSQLLELKQLPGAETLEKLQNALTPLVKRRGRMLEAHLREIGEMAKCNFYQFDTAAKRVSLLGADGLTLEDFDYDPGTLVPANEPVEPGQRRYQVEDHLKNIRFFLVPNTLLEYAQNEKRMNYLVLRRMGEVDHQSFLEVVLGPGAPIGLINERLSSELDQKIAAVAGINPTEGRPPTGQVTPHMEDKGARPPAVAES